MLILAIVLAVLGAALVGWWAWDDRRDRRWMAAQTEAVRRVLEGRRY